MTNELTEYAPDWMDGSFDPKPGGGWYKAEYVDPVIEQLRGNLSLAEDGLASAMQEIEGLKAGRENEQLINDNGAKEIARLRACWAEALENVTARNQEIAQLKLNATEAEREMLSQTEKRRLADVEIAKLNDYIKGLPDEPLEQRIGLGDPVTYAPRYPSQLPREGWTVERLPPEPVYVIKHPEGSMIAVVTGEIQPAQKSSEVPK